MTLWNHGLSTYDCLSGGGGSGLVALSDDKEVLLLEWGNVADFLSGDLSESSNKTHVKAHVSFAVHSFRSSRYMYWKCVKIWFEAKCFTNLLNSGGLEWERPESSILKDSLDDESQCLRTRFFLDLRWLSPFFAKSSRSLGGKRLLTIFHTLLIRSTFTYTYIVAKFHFTKKFLVPEMWFSRTKARLILDDRLENKTGGTHWFPS